MSLAMANNPQVTPTQGTVLINGARVNVAGDVVHIPTPPVPLAQSNPTVLVGGKPIGTDAAWPTGQRTVFVGGS